MPPLSAISSVNQSGLQQMQLQQALRNADQAEQNARSLRNQADSAQRAATRAQEGARALDIEAGQAQDRAGQARQGVAAQAAYSRSNSQLGEMYSSVVEKFQAVVAPVDVSTTAMVSVQGQVTGGSIDVTA